MNFGRKVFGHVFGHVFANMHEVSSKKIHLSYDNIQSTLLFLIAR
jgi:hypothetical protein